MLVRDLGEFGVIERLNRMVTGRGAGNDAVRGWPLLVDTGDDAAAWQAGGGPDAASVRGLFTTDTMVEGVHFTRGTTPWRELGWKAVAANVSDVAAMGGRPAYALITLGLPPDTAVADLEEMYRGMLELGDRFGLAIVGGDIVRSPVFFVTTALTGVAWRPPLLRSAARPGDAVAVTGWLGSSAGGLRLLLEAPDAAGVAADFLRHAHQRPAPAVDAGQLLAEAGIAAAMDVSDGLADDLGKLCAASGVAAQVRAAAVPAHPMLRRQFPGGWLPLALGGGEDYVLLFTGPPAVVAPLIPRLGDGAAVIGTITAETAADADAPPGGGRVTVVDDAGREISLSGGGWDHFGN